MKTQLNFQAVQLKNREYQIQRLQEYRLQNQTLTGENGRIKTQILDLIKRHAENQETFAALHDDWTQQRWVARTLKKELELNCVELERAKKENQKLHDMVQYLRGRIRQIGQAMIDEADEKEEESEDDLKEENIQISTMENSEKKFEFNNEELNISEPKE